MIKVDHLILRKENNAVTIVQEICLSQILILSVNTIYNF